MAGRMPASLMPIGGFWQSSQHVPSRAESLVRVERSGVGSAAGAGTGRHARASRALRVPAGPACGRPLTRGTLRPWGRELRTGRWPCPPHAPAASCPGGSFRISAESLRGEQVADLLDGFAVAEAFSGPAVEFGGDRVQVGGAVHGQVAALREVLAQQAVGVLVAAALPGRVRVAEVDLEVGGDGDAAVRRASPGPGPRSAIGAAASGRVWIFAVSASRTARRL